MIKYITIKADTNDADYITSQNEITDEILEFIMPVVNAIKEYDADTTIKTQKYNWYDMEDDDREPNPKKLYVDTGKCTEDQYEYFSELCPYEGGIHTIESVEIITVLEKLL